MADALRLRNLTRCSRLVPHLSQWPRCVSSSGRQLRCHRLYRYRGYSTQVENFKEEPRINPVGIQYLSKSLHQQLFGGKTHSHKEESMSSDERLALVNLSKQFLKNFDLLGKKTSITEPISFELPKLQGNSLDEHFQKLGHFASEPYKTMCVNKFTKIIPRPNEWKRIEGWMRYEPGKVPEKVSWPLEDTLVFDVETLYKISSYPTLAIALSDKAWYLWCSPYICDSEKVDHLIPMDTLSTTRLVIGHNVGYDRARVLDEYNFQPSKAFFLDTQSLHVASSGLCSRQRPKFIKNKKSKDSSPEQETLMDDNLSDGVETSDASLNGLEEDPWLNVSAMNSLSDVALLHCGIRMDKEPRNFFSTTDKNDIIDNFEYLVNYCATDVHTTSQVFDKVFPLFLDKCPHPVSFGSLRSLSSCILPTRHKEWNDYLKRSEQVYQQSKRNIEGKIIEILETTVKLINSNERKEMHEDPWLRQLDWSIKPLRMTKKGVPAKSQKLPGYPEWYRSLFPNKTSTRPQITIKSRNIPIFFKLSWEGYPTIWTNDNGWCFAVPRDLVGKFQAKNYVLADDSVTDEYRVQTNTLSPGTADDQLLFKIPHPNGPQFNCTTLLSKPYIHYFEKGILTSESEFAHEALNINSCGSYWMSARERISSQFLVPQPSFPDAFKPFEASDELNDKEELGIILPAVIPMGTVTRRAVENTWLTASNAKANRIGSELKAQIKAPKGYCFVGADVDSEELWIASLVGDSVFNIHGGTAIGWMCLEGTKNEGTDLHTKTAQILGCTRDEAKIFNYGRIYGAGAKFAAQLLKKFNPSLPDAEAKTIADKLYENTKGKTKRSKVFKKFWYGGSESILFNKLESIAEQDESRTPVLGCGITVSLMKKNLGANSFLPSRINWAIQSSGVDYLHLLTCSMHYLIAKYQIKARLSISIHDEIRFLVAEEDKYRAAMALQVSNIWTRAIFCEQMGIDDLPQNCAFFSAVDIDHVMRKEVDMNCITPSNPVPIPHGESIDITKLLDIHEGILKAPDPKVEVSHFPYTYREPVFAKYNRAYSKEFWRYFLKMQIQNVKWKVDALEAAYIQETTSKEFKQRNLPSTYGLLDYLRDVRDGKKQKITIMENEPFKEHDEITRLHHLALQKKYGKPLYRAFEEKPRKYVATSSEKKNWLRPDTLETPSSEPLSKVFLPNAIDDLNQAAETTSVDERPGNEQLSEYATVNDTEGRPNDGQLSLFAKSSKLSHKRSRKVYGGKKEFEAFHQCIDHTKEFVSQRQKELSKIPVDDVVIDVLNESSNDVGKEKKKTRSRKKKAVKTKSKTVKEKEHPNVENLDVPVVNTTDVDSNYVQQKLH